MKCKTCDSLLAAYKLWVDLFKQAVHNIPGALGDDFRLFAEEAERLGQKCKDTSDALMEHWHHEHNSL